MEVKKLNPPLAENYFPGPAPLFWNIAIVLFEYLYINENVYIRRRRLGIFSFFWKLKMEN